MWTVMRRPVFMEDEGRHFWVGNHPTKEAAEAWIAAQKDEFYKPCDYYAVGPE